MTKLEKIRSELEKARIKKEEWTRRVEKLEKEYSEEEKSVVHSMVLEAHLTPEKLAQIIALANAGQVGVYPEGMLEKKDPEPDAETEFAEGTGSKSFMEESENE